MKSTIRNILERLALLVCGIILSLQPSTGFAQGTAFTYQGWLNDGSGPATGSYDLTFTLYDAPSGGGQVGAGITNAAVAVSNGLFTVSLDFGNVFDGNPRWLGIGVSTNGPGSGFVSLSARQALTATPYATHAASVSAGGLSAGTYASALTLNNPANQVSGSFTGDGAGVTNVNAQSLNGLTSSEFWKLGGNSGTTPGTHFLGTTDNQPLEVRANGQRVLRMEPTSGGPNLVAGFSGNSVLPGTTSATIAGGGQNGSINRVTAIGGTVGGGLNNAVSNWHGTVSGGANNTAAGYAATVGGGAFNLAGGDYGAVGGGRNNLVSGPECTVAGGRNNTASAFNAAVGGGYANTASGNYASVPGGLGNAASAPNSFAAGYRAKANHRGTFVWADSTDADFSSTATNQFNVRATGGARFETGGAGLTIESGGNFTDPQLFLQQTNAADYSRLRLQSGSGPAWDIALEPAATPSLHFYNGSADNLLLAQNGDATLRGSLKFTSGTLRQMVNLWDGEHGMGVQSWTTYFRTIGGGANGGFAWYKGGVHADAQFDPGLGGVKLMSLTSGSLEIGVPVQFPTAIAPKLNLWSDRFVIGMQDFSMYFRCNDSDPTDGFIWYKGGVHSNAYADAGGGTELMHLDSSGLWVKGTFLSGSDRNSKENFIPVDTRAVLDKVAALPLSEWNYKQDAATRHLGPMAQDFYAAFGVGPDDKHIATVDADGVALAAIQGLNEKVEVGSQKSEANIRELRAENTELRQRVSQLEQLVHNLTTKRN